MTTDRRLASSLRVGFALLTLLLFILFGEISRGAEQQGQYHPGVQTFNFPEPISELWSMLVEWIGFPASIIIGVLKVFAVHVHLILLPFIVFLLVYCKLGERYGIHDLFWHSKRSFAFSNGLVVGAYLLMCLFLGYARYSISEPLTFHKPVYGELPRVVTGGFYCFGFFTLVWIVASFFCMLDNGIFGQHRTKTEDFQSGGFIFERSKSHAHWVYHALGMSTALLIFGMGAYLVGKLYAIGFNLHDPLFFGLSTCSLAMIVGPIIVLAIWLPRVRIAGHSRLFIGLALSTYLVITALHHLEEPTVIRFWMTVFAGLMVLSIFWILYLNKRSFASDQPDELRIGMMVVGSFSTVTLFFSSAFYAAIFVDPYLKDPNRNEATTEFIEILSKTGTLVLEWIAFLIMLGFGILSGYLNRNRYRLPFFGKEYYRKKPLPLHQATTGETPRRSAEEILKAPEDGSPIVIVCASGGGSKAASWTVAVLNRLEEAIPGFSRSVRLFFGASGGMVGSAYWAATAAERRSLSPEDAAKFRREMYDRTSGDQLSPVVATLFSDLLHMFAPFGVSHRLTDRGNRLERIWEKLYRSPDGSSPMNRTLDDTLEAERSGEMASMVFSPMIVENGKRLIITNVDIEDVITNRVEMLNGTVDVSTSGLDLRRAYPEAGGRIALKTAARLSATFPGASPVPVLPPAPGLDEEERVRMRVLDAGFYDNYGLNLATEFLARHRDILERQGWPKVLLIQIDVNRSPDQRKPAPKQNPLSLGWTRFIEGATSTIAGGRMARSAIPYYRNDEAMHRAFAPRLEKKQREGDGESVAPQDDFMETIVFRGAQDASMSWYLNPTERESILADAVAEVEKNLDCMREFFALTRVNAAADQDSFT